ncbi:MAG: outer membrane protein assembly factor BamD [Nitrospinales bacterium]
MLDSRVGISFRLILIIIISCLGASACQTDSPAKIDDPALLLKKGAELDKEKNYFLAGQYYKRVLDDFPDSRERVKALMLQADNHMKRKEYAEAKLDYQQFIELYPAWPNVDRAHFYLAMTDFMIIDNAARDQSHTRSALEQFDRLVKNFPQSPYRQRAEAKARECRNKLAANILEIGKYYFRTRSYQSAINRFKKLLNTYPNQKFNDEALFLLAESYRKEQNFREARLFYNQLVDQYPKSPFTREALLRLKKSR